MGVQDISTLSEQLLGQGAWMGADTSSITVIDGPRLVTEVLTYVRAPLMLQSYMRRTSFAGHLARRMGLARTDVSLTEVGQTTTTTTTQPPNTTVAVAVGTTG